MDLLVAANTVAQAQADTAPASGTPGWATDGNPATGVLATDAPAWHYNMMMAELLAIIKAAGITPSNTDWTQVLTALRVIFAPAQYGAAPYSAALSKLIGGYPKFAVVTDAVGTFWVSTADANITVPGDTGASWKSLFDGLATQAWANGLFATIAQLEAETSARSSGVASRVGSVNYIRFTSSGTYMPSSSMLFCRVTAKGGGGGAGGAWGNGSSYIAATGGGGEGATAFGFCSPAQIGASQSVVVGAGGAGGAGGGAGADGGYSWMGSLVNAGGGSGSVGIEGNKISSTGGMGGRSGNGPILTPGSSGQYGVASASGSIFGGAGGGGGGGDSVGIGANFTSTAGADAAASSGAGGGGAAAYGTAVSGGNGGSGFVEIIEYIGG